MLILYLLFVNYVCIFGKFLHVDRGKLWGGHGPPMPPCAARPDWKEGDDTGRIKILQSFGEHINYLSADKCEVLLHELKRFPKLPEIYNTLIKRIKDKAVFEISPTPETRIAIKILSELNIANESHDKLTRYHTELKESYLTRNEKMKLINRSSSNYNNKKILTNEPLDNVSFLNAYLCRYKLKNI